MVAECPDATGRAVPDTELPFINPTSASMGVVGLEARVPPWNDFCFLAVWLLGDKG